jgi:hypothetical protein
MVCRLKSGCAAIRCAKRMGWPVRDATLLVYVELPDDWEGQLSRARCDDSHTVAEFKAGIEGP